MEFLSLGHRRAPFATGEDDGLCALWYGELALQFGGGGEKRGDARRDVVGHAVGIEKSHLLLYGTEDAGVAGMQPHDVIPLVVVCFHQFALLFEGHRCRRAHHGTGFGTSGQFAWHKTACIENKVGFLQHPAASHRHQVGVAGTCTHDFHMTLSVAQILVVDGEGGSPVLALHFLHNQPAMVGTQQCCCLAHTRCSHMLFHHITGVGNFHGSQFLGSEKHHFFFVFLSQHVDKRFIGLHVDGAIAMGAGQYTLVRESLVYLVVDELVVIGMMGESETYGSHHRHEVQFEHAFGCIALVWRHHDEQFVFLRVGLADVIDEADVGRECLLQIVGALVAHLQQQCRRLTVDKSKDAVVHVIDIAGYRPVESLFERVECPKSGIVALGGDDGVGSQYTGYSVCQVIGTADMA